MKLRACKELKSTRPAISLDGQWEFSYDAKKVGVRQGWFSPRHSLPERTVVPGCPQVKRHGSAGKGEDAYEGLPETKAGVMLRYPCFHDAWFKRQFEIPASWKGRQIWLRVGGVKPSCRLWLNGKKLGSTISSRTPLKCDITRLVSLGKINTLTACIEWREIQLNGVFDTIGWSGFYRSIWLEATPQIYIADVEVQTDISPCSAKFRLQLAGRMTKLQTMTVKLDINGIGFDQHYSKTVPVAKQKSSSGQSIKLNMPGARLWDTESPNLYRAKLTLLQDKKAVDSTTLRFGLREIRTDGFRVLLNGKPVFLRGACDDHYYPESVAPPADKNFFKKRIRQAQAYGFNYTKSCVDVFTEEFLDAADELGYLVCQEMPFGLFGKAREGRFDPDEQYKSICREELENIVSSSVNHPSVIIYSTSSELHRGWLENSDSFTLFSRDLPKLAKKLAPNALVFDCTGPSDNMTGCEQAVPVHSRGGTRTTDLAGSWLLWNQEMQPLLGPITGLDPVTLPFIHHEFCWITALSNPSHVERMRRLPVVPLHIPEMIKAAGKNGTIGELPRMEKCSKALQYALRKHALELTRLGPKSAGYHHWLIHDFPYCREGVFNEFWEAPRDLPAEVFRQYNADTVICLRDFGRRCFTNGESPQLALAVSHFGNTTLRGLSLHWQLKSGTRILSSGRAHCPSVSAGELVDSGPLKITIPCGNSAMQLELSCELRKSKTIIASNRWNLWSFPAEPLSRVRSQFSTTLSSLDGSCPSARLVGSCPEDTDRYLVTDIVSEEHQQFMRRGGRVLLLAPPESRGYDLPRGQGPTRYRTVPYNLGTTGNMGTVIHRHPIMDRMPHEGWCDFVFEPLIEGSAPFSLEAFRGIRIKPIIRSIGHVRTMEDKAYLFEVNVGKGRLLASSLGLANKLGRYPAADYLLAELLRYLGGKRLSRSTTVETLPKR